MYAVMRMRRMVWVVLALAGAGFSVEGQCELEARLLGLGDVQQCEAKAKLLQKEGSWQWKISDFRVGGATPAEDWLQRHGERFLPAKSLLLALRKLDASALREKRRLRVDLPEGRSVDLVWEKDLPEGLQVKVDGRWTASSPVPLPHGALLSMPEVSLPLDWAYTGRLLYEEGGLLQEGQLELRVVFLGASPEEEKERPASPVIPTLERSAGAAEAPQQEQPPQEEAPQEAPPKATPTPAAVLRALGFSYEWKATWKIRWTEDTGDDVSAQRN